VGLEWGSLSLVSTTEELLGKKQRLRSRKPRIWQWGYIALPCDALYQQKLVLTSTSGGRSFGIIRSWTKTTVCSFLKLHSLICHLGLILY
jgi:hypothetical protein